MISKITPTEGLIYLLMAAACLLLSLCLRENVWGVIGLVGTVVSLVLLVWLLVDGVRV